MVHPIRDLSAERENSDEERLKTVRTGNLVES